MKRLESLVTIVAMLFCTAAEPYHFNAITNRTPGVARIGSLRYENGKTVVTGRVYVRTSNFGGFILRFFDDSGGTKLLELEQDNHYSRIRGRLIGMAWEGPTNAAPPALRGWLSLDKSFINQMVIFSLRTKFGDEKFSFNFIH